MFAPCLISIENIDRLNPDLLDADLMADAEVLHDMALLSESELDELAEADLSNLDMFAITTDLWGPE